MYTVRNANNKRVKKACGMWQNTLTYGTKNNRKRKNEIAATLTLPYLTLSYFTLLYLALPYLTSLYFSLPNLTLRYHTSPYLTFTLS